MKTLLYKMILRIEDKSWNEGTLAVYINEDNEISNFYGIFSMDYLEGTVLGEQIHIRYYEFEPFFVQYNIFNFIIKNKGIEFPFNLNIHVDDLDIEIITLEKIKDDISYYINRIKEVQERFSF